MPKDERRSGRTMTRQISLIGTKEEARDECAFKLVRGIKKNEGRRRLKSGPYFAIVTFQNENNHFTAGRKVDRADFI